MKLCDSESYCNAWGLVSSIHTIVEDLVVVKQMKLMFIITVYTLSK